VFPGSDLLRPGGICKRGAISKHFEVDEGERIAAEHRRMFAKTG